MMSKSRKSDPASLSNTSAPAVSHRWGAVQKQRPHLHRHHRKGLPIWESLAPKSGFLQIPPYDGHPCLWLNPPATGQLQPSPQRTCAHRAHEDWGGRRLAAAPRIYYTVSTSTVTLFIPSALTVRLVFPACSPARRIASILPSKKRCVRLS